MGMAEQFVYWKSVFQLFLGKNALFLSSELYYHQNPQEYYKYLFGAGLFFD